MSYAQSMRVINSSGLKRNASPTITANDEEMMDLVPNDPNFFQGTAVKSSGESSLMSRIIQGATVLTAFAVVVGWGTMQGGYLYQPNNASPTTSSQTPGETTNSFMVQVPPALQITSDLRKNITILAENEYGRIDQASLFLYGLDMVVEPHRETTLRIEGARVPHTLFHWKLFELDDEGAPLDGVDPILDAIGGTRATVVLKSPGHMFRLEVRERDFPEAAMSCVAVTVSCRYVRREIRDLTEADREEFLEALRVYYTMDTEKGQAEYGEDFFNYERITAFHSSPRSKFCYHGGPQFLTAHAAFGIMMERSLQAVNPRVSLSFWDYMIDASEFGTEWANSPIFNNSMFGSAAGSPENGYQLTKGRFGKISVIYDPNDTLVGETFSPFHNAYGFINAAYNYQQSPYLMRTNSFCNLEGHSVFATSDVFFACFKNHQSLNAWEICMEKKVHGDMHGLLGGSFNCNVDMKRFQNEHPEYSPGLLTFLLEDLTANYWPSNSLMPDYNVCDVECYVGQAEPCGCTCTIDPLTLPDETVYNVMEGFLESASKRFAGAGFISYDESRKHPWGFNQENGSRMSDDSTIFLLRHLAKIGCEPGTVGIMCTGASPMDPLFFVLHPMFEKALHVLWMSPQFRDSYNFDWVDGTCQGSKLEDPLPFTEESLGFGPGTDFLTNADLMLLLHASNPRLPYIYERFDTWGSTKGWEF